MRISGSQQQPTRLSRAAKAAQADNIRVFCRVRPLSKEEESKAATRELCVAFPNTLEDTASLTCTTAPSALNASPSGGVPAVSTGNAYTSTNDSHHFTFSEVFRPLASQSDVFTNAGLPSVKDVMAGYNSTIFVYGQTGSGKTHTMFGRVHHNSAGRASAFSALVRRQSSTNANGTAVLGGGGGGSADASAAPSTSSEVNFLTLRAAEEMEAGDEEEAFSPALPTFSQDDNDRPSSRRSADKADQNTSTGRRGSDESAFASRPSPPDTFRSTSRVIPTSVSDQTSGIVPRAVREIFTHIYSAPVTAEFEIRIFFVEVYMEQVRDLLAPEGHKAKLQVREDVAGKHFYVEDCEMPFVTSPSEIMHLVQAGLKRRATSATAMNETSSRSHCILNITVKSTDRRLHESRVGKLFLVDLAGSEKVSKTQSSGMRLEEAKLINRSLTSLSQVISSLSEGQRHTPYRDSVLTKILKDSLGGNARTSLIICCSPSAYNAPETLSTLRFGARAKTIKNRAIVNRQYSIEELETMLRVAREEIAELQRRLMQQQHKQVRATASSSPGSAASVGAETMRPDGSSPPHAVRRLDMANITTADEDARRTANSDDEGEVVMLSLRQRSREKMQLNDLLAEMGVLKDAVKDAEEANAALREERDAVRQRAACLSEECALWEASYLQQRHRLAQRQQALQQRDGVIATQQNEIRALIGQMEEWLEPLRVATAAVEEVTGEHLFGKSVSRPRWRTLIALESPPPNGITARYARADSAPRGGSPPLDGASGRAGSAGGPQAARNPKVGSGGEAALFPPSGQESLLPSQHTSPTAGRRQHADDFPLSPSARANQAMLERAAASRSARMGSVESPAMAPSACHHDPYRSPPPNVSPRMPAPLQLTPLTSASALVNDTGSSAEASVMPLLQAEAEADAELSEAAAARIVELEHELSTTQKEFDAIRQNYAASTLELQLSQKKLLIRQNRIESLKMSLQQECDTNKELRQTIEKEHKGLRNLVQVARNDATYWRRRYEEVCATTGTPVTSGLDPALTPPPQSSDRAASPAPQPVAAEGNDSALSERRRSSVVADQAHGAPSKPREDSRKRAEGFNVFKSIFGGQRQ